MLGHEFTPQREGAKGKAYRNKKDLKVIVKMGQESTRFVRGLVKPGDKVRLEFDVEKRDKYGGLPRRKGKQERVVAVKHFNNFFLNSFIE